MPTTSPSRTILYISHGAGPLPVLGDGKHDEMVAALTDLAATIPRPERILVVSAHWEESRPTVTSGAAPELIYDYYGFPEESYSIRYPAPGDPELARAVAEALVRSGLDCVLDGHRGFDHGMFIPLGIMYPEADIPCVQLSLNASLDAEAHIALGEALSSLDQDGLLVLGSGFSFHNMRAFFSPPGADREQNEGFEAWLIKTLSDTGLPEAERRAGLAAWDRAPFARYCHPREEHLLPLHVCYGLAGQACAAHRELTVFGKKASFYQW